jgi:hypothetical protein
MTVCIRSAPARSRFNRLDCERKRQARRLAIIMQDMARATWLAVKSCYCVSPAVILVSSVVDCLRGWADRVAESPSATGTNVSLRPCHSRLAPHRRKTRGRTIGI